ncbi:MAG: class I SAM-dependent methyltransferase, partial [bacterium]
MPIIKASSFQETYQAKASASDINELSGRTGRPDLTEFVGSQVLSMAFRHSGHYLNLVDIGCGDGTLLRLAADSGRIGGLLMGVLPTLEEVSRVSEHLRSMGYDQIQIMMGSAASTTLPDNAADIVICNGVLHGCCSSQDDLEACILELARITRPEGFIYFGELPEVNEVKDRSYGDSILAWLAWSYRSQEFIKFLINVKAVINGAFGKEPFVIKPKHQYYIIPADFLQVTAAKGISVVEHSRHIEISPQGTPTESPTRWNYLARKERS